MSLPRIEYCPGLKCRLYHHGQETTLHPKPSALTVGELVIKKTSCKKAKACRVCQKEGHEPGSHDCKHFVQPSETVVAFQGIDNPLSNFYPCEIKAFGEVHQSAKYAYQFTKAIRSGDSDAVQKIKESSTALEAKRIGHTVKDPVGWNEERETVMEEVIML